MKNFDLRKLQMLQLEISKEIKRICDENNIQYFLSGGTLLGAVRHKGFIPWDDDMDIGMFTSDYEKFKKIAPELLGGRFSLQSDSESGYVFSKVRMNRTHMHEELTKGIEMNDGIFVDVFPCDAVSQKNAIGSWHLKKLRIMGKLKMLKSGYHLNAITKKPINKLINTIITYIPISRKKIIKIIAQEIMQADRAERSFFVERDGMFKGDFVFPKRVFENLIELQFEDTFFKVPEGYHEYLLHAYGDYMKYPPVSEREKGHSVSGIELELSYESYFKNGDC